MRKRGGEREQFWPQKLVLRTGVLSHPVCGWVRTGADGPYGTVVPHRYLMRKRGGEREQFWPQKLVLRTGVLSHPVYGWVRTGTDGPYGLSFGRFDPKSSTNT